MATPISNVRYRLRTAQGRLVALRAYDPVRRRTRLPGPLGVQIQTIDRCNAACVMCPYSTLSRPGPAHTMPMDLYEHVLRELGRPGTLHGICLMLQNEPLLDRHLAERVRVARRLLGRALHVSVVTNASALTPARIDDLLESGVTHVAISIDAAREETFRAIRRGLDFQRVVGHTEALLARRGRVRVTVRFLRQRANEGEEAAFARFWHARGATVGFDEMTNRAGMLDAYERMRSTRKGLLQRAANAALNRLAPACPLPFTNLTILWDGRAILCCHDWEPRAVVGDLAAQPLAEVWNGEAINRYRHLLWTRRTGESLVCRDCSLAKGFWNA